MAWDKTNWVNLAVDAPIVFDDLNAIGGDLDDAYDAVDTVHDITGATNKHKDPMVGRIVARISWSGAAYSIDWQESDFKGLTISVAKAAGDDSCDVTVSGSGFSDANYLPFVTPLLTETVREYVDVQSATVFNVRFHNDAAITGTDFGVFIIAQAYA